jgi:hypothetical protein
MVNKGMVFIGDSFTWGHGLWQYFPNDTYLQDDSLDLYYKSEVLKRYHESTRWPRLVANHFKTFEVCKQFTAGSDYETIFTISQFFNQQDFGRYGWSGGPDLSHNLRYQDISYLIFGVSFIDRCPHVLPNDTNYYLSDITPDMMVSFGFDSVEDFLEYHTRYYFYKIKSKLKHLELNGVKTLWLSNVDTYIEFIENDHWMSDRLITFKYGDDNFTNLYDIGNMHSTFSIEGDPYFEEYQNREAPKDGHPSLNSQKLIASNVINAIETREKEGW